MTEKERKKEIKEAQKKGKMERERGIGLLSTENRREKERKKKRRK